MKWVLLGSLYLLIVLGTITAEWRLTRQRQAERVMRRAFARAEIPFAQAKALMVPAEAIISAVRDEMQEAALANAMTVDSVCAIVLSPDMDWPVLAEAFPEQARVLMDR